jgi:starch phosphorylase
MLENEIILLYFAKNSKGYSPEWIQYIKNSLAKIAPIYTTKRMLDDYIDRFYSKQAKRAKALKANNCAKVKEIVAWKENMAANWDNIGVIESSVNDMSHYIADTTDKQIVTVTVDAKQESGASGLGFELVIVKMIDGAEKLHKVIPFTEVKVEGSKVNAKLEMPPTTGGSFKCAIRMYANNEALPHRQDFCYLRWI